MNKITIILFLIITPLTLMGQVYDAIPYFGNTFKVITKSENERVEKIIEKQGGGLVLSNYKIIHSTGTVIKESYYKDYGKNGILHIIMKDGKKSWNQQLLKNATLTKEYFKSGNLKFEFNSFFDEDSGYTEMRNYYDNQFNTLESLYNEECIIPEEFKRIIIENWRTNKYLVESLVVEQEIGDSVVYVPLRETFFHPNGNIKEKGSYSQRQFFEFRNKDFYQEWLNGKRGYIDNFAIILNPKVRVKHGEWGYYDEEGKLLRIENYKDGKLVD